MINTRYMTNQTRCVLTRINSFSSRSKSKYEKNIMPDDASVFHDVFLVYMAICHQRNYLQYNYDIGRAYSNSPKKSHHNHFIHNFYYKSISKFRVYLNCQIMKCIKLYSKSNFVNSDNKK